MNKHNPKPPYKIWKTVTIGTGEYQSNVDILNDLIKLDLFKFDLQMHHDGLSDQLDSDRLGEFPKHFVKYSDVKKKVNLVRIKPYQLGITKQYCEFVEIVEAAKRHGLKLCDYEVPLRLRFQYRDDEVIPALRFSIATKPFPFRHSLLVLERNTIKYNLYGGHDDFEYSKTAWFVFELI